MILCFEKQTFAQRNNLIFYGLNNDVKETPEILMSKIQTVIKVSLAIRRDIPIPKVTRMYNGKPSVTELADSIYLFCLICKKKARS